MAAHGAREDAAVARRDRPPKSTWQRFLEQKTTPQRLLLALAGIVTAVVAIGAGVVTLWAWIDAPDDRSDIGSEDVVEASELRDRDIESGTDDADELVQYLVSVAGGDPVALDLTVRAHGEDTIGSHLALWYNCEEGAVIGDGACNKVRLEFPADAPPPLTRPLGWRFAATYRVTIRTGVDYGQDLDISFDDIST